MRLLSGLKRILKALDSTGMSIGLILLVFGVALWVFKVPKTADEFLAWLPGTLVFLGIVVFARKLVHPGDDEDDDKKSHLVTDEGPEVPNAEPTTQPGQHSATVRILPLTGKGLLKMIWGITLSLSHEVQERTMGDEFNTDFKEILVKYTKEDLHRSFIENLVLVMAGTLRDIAFMRENHVLYLDYKANKVTERRKNLESVADPGSFSGPGLYSKIGTFVGAGSIGPFVVHASDLQATVLVFGAIGFAGAVGVTLLVRAYSYLTEEPWEHRLMVSLNKYWRKNFKVDVTNQLFYARRHIKRLIHQCYDKNTAAKILKQDRFLTLDDDNDVAQINQIISEEILPPDHLKWPPYYVNPPETTAPEKGAKGAHNKAKSTFKTDEDKEAKAMTPGPSPIPM